MFHFDAVVRKRRNNVLHHLIYTQCLDSPLAIDSRSVFLLLFLLLSAKIPCIRSRLLANGARFVCCSGRSSCVHGMVFDCAYYFGWGISGTAIGEDVIGIFTFLTLLSQTYTHTQHSPSVDVRVCARDDGLLILMSCQQVPTTFLYSLVGNFVVSF